MANFEKNLGNCVNNLISSKLETLNPSITFLFKYGLLPAGLCDITSSNIEKLDKRIIDIDNYYNTFIFKNQIFDTFSDLTKSNYDFENNINSNFILNYKTKSDFFSDFSLMPFELLRLVLLESFNNKPYNINLQTLKELNSTDYLEENKVVNVLFNENFILSYRRKTHSSLYHKYMELLSELNNEELELLPTLLKKIVVSQDYGKNHDDYMIDYGENLNKIMLGDIYAAEIAYLSSSYFYAQLDHSCIDKPDYKLSNFNYTIKVKDHLLRRENSRPGGFHFVGVNDADFPFEFKVKGRKCFINQHFGPYSHDKYKSIGRNKIDKISLVG